MVNKRINGGLKFILTACCFVLSTLGDWGIFLPAWCLVFHLCRDLPFRRKASVFIVVSYFLVEWLSHFFFQHGVLFSLILLYFYGGKRGNNSDNRIVKGLSKWGFYIYYGLHMAILAIVAHFIL
jgi:energy-coupling factor transporter transmembrane protein EcfT